MFIGRSGFCQLRAEGVAARSKHEQYSTGEAACFHKGSFLSFPERPPYRRGLGESQAFGYCDALDDNAMAPMELIPDLKDICRNVADLTWERSVLGSGRLVVGKRRKKKKHMKIESRIQNPVSRRGHRNAREKLLRDDLVASRVSGGGVVL